MRTGPYSSKITTSSRCSLCSPFKSSVKLLPGSPVGCLSESPVSLRIVGSRSQALIISLQTVLAGMCPGQEIRNGTLTAESYIFIGNVPLPFPQTPCCPMLIPLSAVKRITVLSASPCSSTASSSLPICSSIALIAAK